MKDGRLSTPDPHEKKKSRINDNQRKMSPTSYCENSPIYRV